MTATAPGATQTQSAPEGMRLLRFEVLNWGTFDQYVWRLDLDGGNCLVTGNVGSGKSTLIDGLSLLFNPPKDVSFNLAGGAAKSERTLRTYALGAHRNVSDSDLGVERAQYLRKPAATRSILLAVFGTSDGRQVSAGMWLRFVNEAASPDWTYFLVPDGITIEGDLTGHTDVRALRQHLKNLGGQPYESYSKYAPDLLKALGLSSASALSLLNRTVSMKSVTDITDFVRKDMLDEPDTRTAIAAMLSHYSDLTRAHDLVVDARNQIAKLSELEKASSELNRIDARLEANSRAQESVRDYVNTVRVDLLTETAAELAVKIPALEAERDSARAAIRRLQDQADDLAFQVRSAGGADLTMLEKALEEAHLRLNTTREESAALAREAEAAGVVPPSHASDFSRFLTDVHAAKTRADQERSSGRLRTGELVSALTEAQTRLRDLDREIEQTQRRPSNIPDDLARVRDDLAEALGLTAAELPFAGELLAVAGGEEQWEPAIERLARPFALSLLVPDEQRDAVAAYVDSRHLGLLLVYYPVAAGSGSQHTAGAGTVASKMTVRPASRYSGWVTSEIARRYTHRCVDTTADLSRYDRAVTRSGQVRDGARREKDDRSQAGDRRRYVLGWETGSRRNALLAARPELERAVLDAQTALDADGRADDARRAVEQALTRLEGFSDYARVDTVGAQEDLDALQARLAALRANPELARLSDELDAVRKRKDRAQEDVEAMTSDLARAGQQQEDVESQLERIGTPVLDLDEEAERLLTESVRSAKQQPTRVQDCDEWEQRIAQSIAQRSRGLQFTRQNAAGEVIARIGEYAAGWPMHTPDIVTGSETSRTELLDRLRILTEDDLPRFESDFRAQLSQHAINNIAVFTRTLEQETDAIRERVDAINLALADVDYQPGTYIALTVEPTRDLAVREFRRQLSAITTDVTVDPYSEERFLAVRELLDRFAGRPDHTDEDARWTRRVADVRNWFTFAAEERSRDEDIVLEYYSDSGGKSGGQKERLAYTILAASLAYQYGLADGDNKNAFRFAMIDEAFGRGSDDSTRFGLEMFRRLGLQLLIVTPLQKIATIEPYVDAVGYVEMRDDRSRLLSMTVSEFQARRQAAS